MPQSLITIPSVITIENTDGIILSVKYSRENFFLGRFAVFKIVGVWFFLFPIELATERGIIND
jgi:hypothetical protein